MSNLGRTPGIYIPEINSEYGKAARVNAIKF
jgi:hypothetical protein